MKYEDSKVKGIGKKTLKALERIALEASYSLEERGGIEGRNNDTEDLRCSKKPTSSAKPTE